MKLLTTILIIILLTKTTAKPTRWFRHRDADSHRKPGLMDGRNRFWWLIKSPGQKDCFSDSSESSESQSSEDSSEEVPVPDPTTAPVTTAAMTAAPLTTAAMTTAATTTAAMTTNTMEDRNASTPESGTRSTDRPTVTETTPIATTSQDVTRCVTREIPTAPPVTESRGDN